MKSHLSLILLAVGLIAAGCDKKPTAPAPQPSTPPKQESGNPITAPLDYIGAVVKAQDVAIKKIDVASIQNNINLFNAQEGRYPKDLNELVTEKYMPKLPAVPRGMKLDYDAASGKVSVVKQ
jgi:hypothetical protein